MYNASTDRLAAAMGALHQLRSLVWLSHHIHPCPEVVDALENGCPLLGAVSLPSKHSLSTTSCNTPMSNVHTIRLSYHVLTDIPLAYLPSLRHLDITLTQSCSGLDTLLRQVPQLQSLSFCDRTYQPQDELFRDLASAIARLSCLTTLGLKGTSYNDWGSSANIHLRFALLCEALRHCPQLRRFYCDFQITAERLPAFLDVTATLKDLDVFHLELDEQTLDAPLLRDLQRCLPAGLSVLSVSTLGAFTARNAFRELHNHFRNLSFLNVHADEYIERFGHEDSDVLEDAMIEDAMIDGAKRLQLLGCNSRFYDVQYLLYGDARVAALLPWTMALRHMEDSGCEGWNWLIQQSML
ncbi:uncharacterized protein B0H18DRAFT_1105400 [Fomitopsis serialis]|uniref:uncharacterized protein n=1 Tax=Fomitopsis serialis TaxID=139415 RepID=UPI002007F095|nr:uncharacterized protein B0H18DRAFT_1105400 [Neoantrodia serialis]KAH9923045.1 hypothetical protein B0H18DRAFT_1105400 [Neoantrodia serialis]